jgi:hypothetical protein
MGDGAILLVEFSKESVHRLIDFVLKQFFGSDHALGVDDICCGEAPNVPP